MHADGDKKRRGGGEGLEQIRSSLQRLDAFPKFYKDFREQTSVGAIVSIVTILLIVWLVVSETWWWFETEVVETMEVNQARNAELRISFDITFPAVPCSMLSINAEDVTGQQHEGLLHNIFKRRINADGTAVGRADTHSLGGAITTTEELLQEKTRAMKEGRETLTEESAKATGRECGSCYGAGLAGQCCSSCDEVRELYKQKGWSFDAGTVAQCKEEGITGDAQASEQFGCNAYGFVLVPAVAGQLHFAPSAGLGSLHDRIFDLTSWTHSKWNSSHTVNKLAFGPFFEGRINPLDGISRTATEQGTIWQYFVKVVPTEFRALSGMAVDSHQYSVTDHSRVLTGSSRGLPGLHLSYDLSPIRVKILEHRRSLGSFLVGLSAIVGGVYTLAGLADSAIHAATSGGRGTRGVLG